VRDPKGSSTAAGRELHVLHAITTERTAAAWRSESVIGRPWVTLGGVQLVGHGVDRDGELLAHASAEVTGVVDDDQAACRPCLAQLRVLTWGWSTAT
jgi:hypothetical protein